MNKSKLRQLYTMLAERLKRVTPPDDSPDGLQRKGEIRALNSALDLIISIDPKAKPPKYKQVIFDKTDSEDDSSPSPENPNTATFE